MMSRIMGSSEPPTIVRPPVERKHELAFTGARLMFYSHDTYGLGHLRRTLRLARHFRSYGPVSQVVVTGSPLAHRFAFPDGADYIKLPAVVKRAAGLYESRILPLRFRHVRALRSE